MIVWCRECDESWLQINGDWKDVCNLCFPLVPRPDPVKHYPYTLESISLLLDQMWAAREPRRPEYNTVDLAELRRERASYRNISDLPGWKRFISGHNQF